MNRKSGRPVEGQTSYRIEIRGRLDKCWSDWFDGCQIEYGPQTTILTGSCMDQSRLRGILSRLWDLNLTVISVNQVTSQMDEQDSIQRRL